MPGIFGQIGPKMQYDKIGSNMAKSIMHEKWYESKWFTDPCLLGVVQKKKPFKLFRTKNLVFAVMGYLTKTDENSEQMDLKNAKKCVDDFAFLMDLYKELGESFVDHLKGVFNIALIDKVSKKLLVVNDRFGYFPLFYSSSKDLLSFAPEAKAIIAGLNIKPQIEESSIPEFLTFKFPLGDKTFLKEIKRLRPGSILIYDFERNKLFNKQYYYSWNNSQASKRQKPFNTDGLFKLFKNLMTRAVNRCVQGKEKIGIFLSGGIDSVVLTAFASTLNAEVVTFTFGHEGPNIVRDSAREIAEVLGVENHYYTIPSEFLRDYAEEIVYKGEGLIRIRESHFISYLEHVRKKTDTVLMGTLGEIFRDILILPLIQSYLRAKIRGLSLEKFFFKLKTRAFPLDKYPLVFNKDFNVCAENFVASDFHADYIRVMGSTKHKVWNLRKSAREDFRLRWGLQIGFPRWLGQQFQFIEWYLDTMHPFMDYDIFDFAMNLPMWIKQGNMFINRAMTFCFPKLSKIRLEDGTRFEANPLGVFFENQKLKIQTGSQPFFLKRIRTAKNASEYKNWDNYGKWLRTGSKELIDEVLGNPVYLTKYFRKDFIEKTLKDHMVIGIDKDELILDLINLELLHRIFLVEE